MTKRFFCIDGHTCGNPVRLVAGGGPLLNGANMSERRQHFIKEFDWIRKGLMFEPRGHDMMSGSILYPPTDPSNDIGVLYIETSGCLPMCGHGTIGTVTFMIEEGLVAPKEKGKLRLETPAGLVRIDYEQEGERVTSVKLTNIPSYLAATDVIVECPDFGTLKVDVAYGGNFYAIIDPQEGYRDMADYSALELIGWSRAIRDYMNNNFSFVHPNDPTIQGMSHLMWTGQPTKAESTARNAVFYGEKAIDRSPCGTGTSARMAQWAAKGKLKKGDEFTHESIIGSQFIGKVEETATVGNFEAIVPSIKGWARITGHNNIMIDDEDPYAHGFSVI